MTLLVVTHEVYRLYDGADRLLYVGYSGNLVERLRKHSHRNGQPWWPSVAYCTVERFPTQSDALAAEVEAIKAEAPAHNKRSAMVHA